jgi:hypothetical protein
VSARCTTYLALIAGCQSQAREVSQPSPIEVRDSTGAVVASVRPGQPCSAPGWSTEDHGNGTTLVHDGAAVARLQAKPGRYDVFDPQGIPLLHIFATDYDATVANQASFVLRHARVLYPGVIAIDKPPLSVTGTRDTVLAALLSAPELSPDVRALAACRRVLEGS